MSRPDPTSPQRRAVGDSMFESMVLAGYSEVDVLAGPNRGEFLTVGAELAMLGGVVGIFSGVWFASTLDSWLVAAMIGLGLLLTIGGSVQVHRKRRADVELARRVEREQQLPVE